MRLRLILLATVAAIVTLPACNSNPSEVDYCEQFPENCRNVQTTPPAAKEAPADRSSVSAEPLDDANE